MSWQEGYYSKLEETLSEEPEPGAEGCPPSRNDEIKPISIDIQGLNVMVSLRRRFRLTDKVSDIRQAIKDELGDKIRRSSIYFRGTPLIDYHSTLKSIGMNKAHVIFVPARMGGGTSLLSKPPKYDLPHVFKPATHPDLKLSKKPDDVMFIQNELDPRVVAPCGRHCYTGETYYNLMLRMINKDEHSTKLICPVPKCGVEIPFDFVIKAGMLSDEEIRWFEMHLNHRGTIGKIRACPGCNRECERPQQLSEVRVSCGFGCADFCFHCGNKWLTPGKQVCGHQICGTYQKQMIFKKAKMIRLTGGHMCPSVRACPNCTAAIEWQSGCKHFKCSMCGVNFCYLCLKPAGKCAKPSYASRCEPAPRQIYC